MHYYVLHETLTLQTFWEPFGSSRSFEYWPSRTVKNRCNILSKTVVHSHSTSKVPKIHQSGGRVRPAPPPQKRPDAWHNGWEAESSGKVSIAIKVNLNFCSDRRSFYSHTERDWGDTFQLLEQGCFFFKAIKVKRYNLPPRNILFPLLKRDVSRCARDDFTHKLTKKNRFIFIFKGE